MKQHIHKALEESASALSRLRDDAATISAIEAAAQAIITSFSNGGQVFSCGNGGSLCDAMHFAEELSGRFRLNRPGLPATAISDPAHISCVANDFGYDAIFSRYVESHGRRGDVLLAISTSGSSPNVLKAAQAARELGIVVIALTGKPKSLLDNNADHVICTPGGAFSDRIQELHIKVIHMLVELVERVLFPENYYS
ncbi:MAG: SIS domain-containing protein [Desulfuromonadaceae bacterium]